MQDEVFLSTDMVEPGLRNEVWREIARPFFETTQPAGDKNATLEGSIRSRMVGTLLTGPTSFNRQQYSRDRRLILQGGLDHYFVQLFVAGALEGDCDGQAISVGPGDICVFDLARPFTSRVCPGSTISITLPRERLDKAAGGRSLHSVVLKQGRPITRLLADFIVAFADVAADMGSTPVSAIEDAAIALLVSGLARRDPDAAAVDPVLAPILRQRVLEFIDANLAEPDLGPDLLMRRFRVSRAHLYRMFAADGGVATIVRERRLDAAYRELTRSGTAGRTITAIAHDLGFSGSSQFLRAFRARFEMTPTEARQEGFSLALGDRQLSDLQAHFAHQAKRLGGRCRLSTAEADSTRRG